MRWVSIILLSLFGCSGAATNSPSNSAPPASAPAPQPAEENVAEPVQCDGPDAQSLLETSVAFAEEVAGLATRASGDCGVFASGLEQLADSRADWFSEMTQKAEAFKDAGCAPPVNPELEDRRHSAMRPLASIAQACEGDEAFEAAMAQVFGKQ